VKKIPLLLLPGLLNDARLWQAQVRDLAPLAQPVVVDLSGADTIARLALDTLAAAPAPRFALAGLSMGGYVAFEIMRRAPERVAGLALLDTTARPDTPQATDLRRNLMQLASNDFAGVIYTLLPKLVDPTHLREPELVAVIKAMADSLGKDVFIRQQRAIIGRPDSRPDLRNINCPTLVLCGRNDAITPIELHEEIAAGIVGSQLAILERCGHLSPLEQAPKVSAALKNWLLTLEPEPSRERRPSP
jgi:pimeloyl-ACP methyl ester carboxylesterase